MNEQPKNKINYGTDAPGVITNLFLIGGSCLIAFLLYVFFKIGTIHFALTLLVTAVVCLGEAILMVRYARVGKLKQREKILGMVDWKGNEKVLDIGTGRGLLMIGTAKRLTTGKAVGIDIWRSSDLSNNSKDFAEANANIEGVGSKTEVLNQDITKTTFANEEFDVIVSNLCLHNIKNREQRKNACMEITRILKRGGTGIISDFKHIGEYASNFRDAGLKVEIFGKDYMNTFPPLAILKIKKEA